VDETTTVESLMKSAIWPQAFFNKDPENQLYWLYSNEEDFSKFPKPLGREKKILKLMFREEIAQEEMAKKADSANQKISQARS
jgi:hypothetical protein